MMVKVWQDEQGLADETILNPATPKSNLALPPVHRRKMVLHLNCTAEFNHNDIKRRSSERKHDKNILNKI